MPASPIATKWLLWITPVINMELARIQMVFTSNEQIVVTSEAFELTGFHVSWRVVLQ
jgi:hypothetical protein